MPAARHDDPASRRLVLRTAGAAGLTGLLGLAGCTAAPVPPRHPDPSTVTTESPDDVARASTATDALHLLAGARALGSVERALAPLLAAVAADHQAHLSALGARAAGTPMPGPSESGPSITSTPTTSTPTTSPSTTSTSTTSPSTTSTPESGTTTTSTPTTSTPTTSTPTTSTPESGTTTTGTTTTGTTTTGSRALPSTATGSPAGIPTGGPAGAPTATAPSPGPGATTAPGTAAGRVAAEWAAAGRLLKTLADPAGAGISPALAVLLARIAAARAVHADLIAAAARRPDYGPLPPSPPPGADPSASRPDAAGVAVFESMLLGEHAAIYGYGALTAHLAGEARARALVAWRAHLSRRLYLEEFLTASGVTPAPASAAYDLGGPLRSAPQAVALAVRIEDGVAVLAAAAVGAVPGALRADPAAALVQAARRSAAWRGRPLALPG